MQLLEALGGLVFIFLFLWFFFSLGFHNYGRSKAGAGGCSAAMAGVVVVGMLGTAILGGYFWLGIGALVLGAIIYFNTMESLAKEREERRRKKPPQ